jgi:hypothetical protein
VLGLIAASGMAAAPDGDAHRPHYLVLASLFVTGKGQKAPQPVIELLEGDSRVVRVVDRPAYASFSLAPPRFSPDRAWLAWAGSGGLTVERTDGTARRMVAPCPDDCSRTSFAWSPDSRFLLVGDGNRLAEIAIANGHTIDVLHGPSRVGFTALGWLPGGRVAYLRRDPGRAIARCCRLDLMLALANGTHRRRLWSAADGGIHDTPGTAFTRDGRMALLGTQQRDPNDPLLALLDLGTGKLNSLPVAPGGGGAAFSPDSRLLAIGGERVSVFALDGKPVRTLAFAGAPMGWSATTGDLYLLGAPAAKALYVSAGGIASPRRLFTLPPTESFVSIDPA